MGMRRTNESRVDAVGFCLSDAGRSRERNEDSFFVDDELGLYVIADGLSGYEDGDLASAIAVSTISLLVARKRESIERVRTGDLPSTELASILEGAFQQANLELEWLSTHPRQSKMGCSVTALLVARSKAVMAHVGDTRLYRLRGRRLRQLSIDHTIATDLVRDGAFSWEKVFSTPFARYLTRAVGTKKALAVDIRTFDVAPGDRFMLCTNGLTCYVPDEVWLEAMVDFHDLEELPRELVRFANSAGGEDDTTVMAIQIPPLDMPRFSGRDHQVPSERPLLDRAA